jgi:hypothetical protein
MKLSIEDEMNTGDISQESLQLLEFCLASAKGLADQLQALLAIKAN